MCLIGIVLMDERGGIGGGERRKGEGRGGVGREERRGEGRGERGGEERRREEKREEEGRGGMEGERRGEGRDGRRAERRGKGWEERGGEERREEEKERREILVNLSTKGLLCEGLRELPSNQCTISMRQAASFCVGSQEVNKREIMCLACVRSCLWFALSWVQLDLSNNPF